MLEIVKTPGEPLFISIVSLSCRKVQETAADILDQHRRTGIANFAILMPLQPQGKSPLKKAEFFAEKIKNIRQFCPDENIKIGILMQQSIGHGARWNPHFNRALDWQRMIRNGGDETIRFCPLDKNFQKYVQETLKKVLVPETDFLLLDDDIRLSIRPDAGTVECFCPLHTEFFNRKYGTTYTPEELRDLINNAPAHDPVQQKFLDSGAETISDFIRMIRKCADEVIPGLPMMLCGCHVDASRHGKWAADAAADGQLPVLRIGNGSYMENAPRELLFRQTDTMSQKLFSPEADLLLDEADTCPHSLYSKSASTMHLHITTALLNGLDGAKLWMADTVHPNPEISDPYLNIVGKNMKMYRELHRITRNFTREGAMVNFPSPANAPHPAFSEMSDLGLWVESFLGWFGMPYSWGRAGDAGVHLLAGETVDWFTDAELDKLLSESCLIDLAAAEKLIARNFGNKIGIRSISPLKGAPALEIIRRNGKICRAPRFACGMLDILPETEVLTDFKAREFTGADEMSDLGPGAVKYGNIIVTAWKVCRKNRIELHIDRRDLLVEYLTLLGALPVRMMANCDAGIWYGTTPEGRLLAAVNYSYDGMDELCFEVEQLPERVELLTPEGTWHAVNFTANGKLLKIAVPLACAQIAVMRLN